MNSYTIKFLILILFVKLYKNEEIPQVKLPDGTIQGRVALTTTNKTYYVFAKIPYAEPPIGPLRFMSPVPNKKWEGVLNTTKLDVICFQTDWNSDAESEDCLYLSVFTSQLNANGTLLPVMFYIYGGGFIVGNSLETNLGPQYFIDNGVIIVTINYRVGPFGFLSTEDTIIPGNNGLKDQQLALQWTYNNIKLFGGDPNQIVIFGQSAGSASVGYQLLNDQNRGLLQGAILQSGSFLSPWAFQRNARQYAFITAGFLNESYSKLNDSKQLLAFLQQIDARKLDQASAQFEDRETADELQIEQGYYWAPVVEPKSESAFLTKKMYGLLKNNAIINVPVLMGINSEENLYQLADNEPIQKYMFDYDKHLDWLVPNDMLMENVKNKTEMGKRIREMYTGDASLIYHLGSGIRYFSDNAFTRSVIKHAQLLSKQCDVYFYQFSYDGKLGRIDAHMDGADSVAHGEEQNYLWLINGWNEDLSKFSETDQLVQKRMIQIWTNFAKQLKPIPKSNEILNIDWPLFNSETGYKYVDITSELEVKKEPKQETFNGWEKLYQTLGYDNFDTY